MINPESTGESPASAEETGKLLAEFRTGSFMHKSMLVLTPLVAAGFAAGWIYMVTKPGPKMDNADFIVGTVFLLGLAGVFLAAFIVTIVALRWRLLLHEKGLLSERGKSARWIPWKDVAQYHEIHVIMHGVSSGHRLYLHPREGKKVAVDGIFRNSSDVALAIKAELVPGLIRDAEERLARGERLDFKYLELSPHGLSKGKEFFAWQELQSVALEDHAGMYYQVVVRVLGRKKPWLTVPATSFRSGEVFFHLIERYRYPGPAAAGSSSLHSTT